MQLVSLPEGMHQIEIEYQHLDRPPMVNFAMFDQSGKMPAKLSNSTLSINEGSAYTMVKNDTGLAVKSSERGKEIIVMEFDENCHVRILQGEFFSLKVHVVKITSKEWVVEKTTGKEGETDMKGKPINLG